MQPHLLLFFVPLIYLICLAVCPVLEAVKFGMLKKFPSITCLQSSYFWGCKDCNKQFENFQSLGGHRAHHSKKRRIHGLLPYKLIICYHLFELIQTKNYLFRNPRTETYTQYIRKYKKVTRCKNLLFINILFDLINVIL